MSYYDVDEFKGMIGKTMESVRNYNDREMVFREKDTGTEYVFYHQQDCCETVEIYDIIGELSDLEGAPILQAEAVTDNSDPDDYVNNDIWRESYTWTFYKFATIKGYVTVRWLGESNGFYSERVDFRIDKGWMQ